MCSPIPGYGYAFCRIFHNTGIINITYGPFLGQTVHGRTDETVMEEILSKIFETVTDPISFYGKWILAFVSVIAMIIFCTY